MRSDESCIAMSDSTVMHKRLFKLGNQYEGQISIKSPFMGGEDVLYWCICKTKHEAEEKLKTKLNMLSELIRDM